MFYKLGQYHVNWEYMLAFIWRLYKKSSMFWINWETGCSTWIPWYWYLLFLWPENWINQNCCLEILLFSTLKYLPLFWFRVQVRRKLSEACPPKSQTPAPTTRRSDMGVIGEREGRVREVGKKGSQAGPLRTVRMALAYCWWRQYSMRI